MNIDRILRIASLLLLLVLVYIWLPIPSRYEYTIINSIYGTFLEKPGWEPIAMDGPNILLRKRKW
jgi:hypothetical protein